MSTAEPTAFDALGGQPFFDELVERFYAGVEADPVLRPLYPEDLTEGKEHLALFLGQYWGGPTTYSDQRGHPRLRARHLPFSIGDEEASRWYAHMRNAVTATVATPALRDQLLNYFESAARFLINRP